MSERDYESEARKEGWRPQEEWTKAADDWVDAKTFVERGENILPIVKSKLERIEQKLAAAERANKQFGEYHKKTLAKEKKEYEKRVSDLEARLSKAVTDGDGDTYTRANRELNDLRRAPPDDVPPDVAAYNALAEQWASENTWYATNTRLATYADGLAERIAGEGFTGRAYFNELTRRVKESFPDEFESPKRKKANAVDEGGERGGGDGKGKKYENLPIEARRACDDFVKQGFMTREDYVSQYEWE